MAKNTRFVPMTLGFMGLFAIGIWVLATQWFAPRLAENAIRPTISITTFGAVPWHKNN
ncbi:MAG: hypothetical protein AAB597_03410 [Patescibacteria group bacterium]